MKIVLGIVILLFATLISLVGINGIWDQHHAITTFIPVDAEITSAQATRHYHSKGADTYSPDISYQYRYNNQLYHETKVLPYPSQGDSNWAHAIVSEFQPPAAKLGPDGLPQTHAYIDPQNPSDAILLKRYAANPYLTTHFGLLGVGIAIGFFTGVIAGVRRKMSAIALDDSSWRLLLPTENLRRKCMNATLWCLWITLAGWLPLLHWYLAANQGGTYGALMGILAAALTLAFAAFAVMRWNITRHLSDARLRVNPVPMQRGQPLALELEADAYRALFLQSAAAKFRCIEHYKERRGNKTTAGTRIRFEHEVILSHAAKIEAGQPLLLKGEFACDTSPPPTTDISAIKAYPHYTWEVRLHIELEHAPDYRAVFPLEVD